MTVKFVAGDIFAGPGHKAYAHGCNCAGKMGAGIAVQFKKRWPQMYAKYVQLCHIGDFEPGDVFRYDSPRGETVYNLGTQVHWRTGAEIENVKSSLESMIEMAEEAGDTPSIIMPQIAAGLGRLDWSDVKQVILDVASESSVELIVAEEYVPAMPI